MNQLPMTKTVTLKDGSTITMDWSDELRCYVTIPEPELCPVCGFTADNHYDWFCNGFAS